MENNNNKCKNMLFDDVKHIKWANNVCELFFTSHTPTAFYVQVACTVKKKMKKITAELYYYGM